MRNQVLCLEFDTLERLTFLSGLNLSNWSCWANPSSGRNCTATNRAGGGANGENSRISRHRTGDRRTRLVS